jgi:hypothetical protein
MSVDLQSSPFTKTNILHVKTIPANQKSKIKSTRKTAGLGLFAMSSAAEVIGENTFKRQNEIVRKRDIFFTGFRFFLPNLPARSTD